MILELECLKIGFSLFTSNEFQNHCLFPFVTKLINIRALMWSSASIYNNYKSLIEQSIRIIKKNISHHLSPISSFKENYESIGESHGDLMNYFLENNIKSLKQV